MTTTTTTQTTETASAPKAASLAAEAHGLIATGKLQEAYAALQTAPATDDRVETARRVAALGRVCAIAGQHQRAAEHLAGASRTLRDVSQDGLANPKLAVEAASMQVRQIDALIAAGNTQSAWLSGVAVARVLRKLDQVGAAGAAAELARVAQNLAELAATRGDEPAYTAWSATSARARVRATCQASTAKKEAAPVAA